MEGGSGEELSGVADSSSGGDDLTTTSVNGIGVKLETSSACAQRIIKDNRNEKAYSTVEDVESDTSHRLLSNTTLFGSPLEGSNTRVLDFVHVLNSLGTVKEDVRTGSVGTETPDLPSLGNIPTVSVGKVSSTDLGVISGSDLTLLNVSGKFLTKRLSLDVESVMLVLRLGKSDHGRLGGDGLSVAHNGVGLSERNTGVVVLEVVKTDFQVELTGTSNDDLTRVTHPGLDTRVGLGKSLKTLDKLGEVRGVLTLNGDLHDRGDRELHDSHVVGSLGGSKGAALEQELVNTDQTDNVTSRTVLDGLGGSTHHENGSLNRLDNGVILLAGNEVRTLDSDLRAGRNGTGEDSTESVESALVGSGNHLGDVDHQRTLGVTVPNTDGGFVVHGTLVKSLNTVLLSGNGRGKVDTDHLEKRVTSGEELSHNNLEELLALEVPLLGSKLDLELLEELGDLILLEVHDRVEKTEDGVKDEHVERTLDTGVGRLGPLPSLGVEVVVTPKLGHELSLVNTELLGVSASEVSERESPTVETGTEGDGTLLGVNHAVSESGVGVGGDDNVDGLNGSAERLVKVFLGNLQLEKSSVDLVNDKDGLDSFTQRLTEHSLGLDTDTLNTVNNDKSTI